MAEIVLRAAVTAVQQGGYNLHQALDTLPVPVYVANRRGLIIYYNRACVGFTGYIPRLRRDRWCVTWKLYTEAGVVLRHDQSPMAVAIRERRAVRGIKAIAERPNGTRVGFLPYPTPLFDADGNLHCAVNMFIDLGEPLEFRQAGGGGRPRQAQNYFRPARRPKNESATPRSYDRARQMTEKALDAYVEGDGKTGGKLDSSGLMLGSGMRPRPAVRCRDLRPFAR